MKSTVIWGGSAYLQTKAVMNYVQHFFKISENFGRNHVCNMLI